MKRSTFSMLIAAGSILTAPAAFAASDYHLQIEGVEGAAATNVDVLSWSWGASNAVVSPRDAASGQASGRREQSPKVTASQNTQSLRGRATYSDLSMTRRSDISALGALAEVQGFSLTLDKASPVLARLCAQGTHIPKATLTARGEQWSLDKAVVSSCTAVPPLVRSGTGAAPTDGRCVSGQCPAEMVTLTLTGQAKHNKTGHVTLMK